MTVQPVSKPAPPTNALKKRRRRGNRREVIAKAAAQLFADKGFTATSIDEIGEAAGVSGPAVYRHFRNKHQILTEIIDEALELMRNDLSELLAAEETPQETLEQLVAVIVRRTVDDRAMAAIADREIRHLEPDERRRITRLQRRLRGDYLQIILEARPDLDEADARVVLACVLNLIMVGAIAGRGADSEMLRDRLLRMSLAAINA